MSLMIRCDTVVDGVRCEVTVETDPDREPGKVRRALTKFGWSSRRGAWAYRQPLDSCPACTVRRRSVREPRQRVIALVESVVPRVGDEVRAALGQGGEQAVRAAESLIRSGHTTVAAVAALTDEELSVIRMVGPRKVAVIRAIIPYAKESNGG